jgi:galactokinase
MNASHQSLRDDYEVSIAPLDQLVTILQSEGAVHGAKLTGAGFGGACVALCKAGKAISTGTNALAKYRSAGYAGRLLVPTVA